MKTEIAHRPSLSPQVEHALHARLLEARRRQLELAEPPEWKDDVDMEDRDMAITLAARARAAVDDIDAALDRMAAGTYGCCQGCARPLPRQRLEAVPTASLCLACAERRVRSGFR
jgi:DnaK suppressor protein